MTPPEVPARQTDRWLEPGKTNVQIIYLLYLASFFIGITGLVGLVMAYVNRGKSEAWIESHYTWLIRTFWIALVASLVSMVLVLVGIGILLMVAIAIWIIVRCVIGLQKVSRGEAIANPDSWLI